MPLGLYIHIPFCRRLCPYCHFYRVLPEEGVAERYLEALFREARRRGPDFSGSFRTLYVGGGTPTILSADWYTRLLSGLSDPLNLTSLVEATIESDGEEGAEQLKALAALGFDRVSVGVKSFAPESLKRLGVRARRHEAWDPVSAARRAGFAKVNLDLIYAFKGQSGEDFTADLERALFLSPDSLSLYPLEENPGQGPRSGDPDQAAAMFLRSRAALVAAGYLQYEVGNFSLPGLACLHNQNYWSDGDYLGLGPSAASSRTRDGVRTRETCRADLAAYLGGEPACETVQSTGRDRAAEALMLALRRAGGVRAAAFALRYGYTPFELLGGDLKTFLSAGLMRISQDRIRLTARGMLLSNEIFERLLG